MKVATNNSNNQYVALRSNEDLKLINSYKTVVKSHISCWCQFYAYDFIFTSHSKYQYILYGLKIVDTIDFTVVKY